MGPVGPAWFSTLSLLGSGSSLVTIVSTVPLLQNTVNQQTRLSIKKTESIKTLNLSPTPEHPEKNCCTRKLKIELKRTKCQHGGCVSKMKVKIRAAHFNPWRRRKLSCRSYIEKGKANFKINFKFYFNLILISISKHSLF